MAVPGKGGVVGRAPHGGMILRLRALPARTVTSLARTRRFSYAASPPSSAHHGPPPLENRYAHRRQRHDRPGRRHARGEGFGAHRRDRRRRRAQLDAGSPAGRIAAGRRRELPHERPARSLRPGRRTVDSRARRRHRRARRAPRGSRRALQRRPGRRSRSSSSPAARGPRRSRTSARTVCRRAERTLVRWRRASPSAMPRAAT